MYSKEKIFEILHEIKDGSEVIKPYLIIAQPRRNLEETPAQEFDNHQISHVNLTGYSRGFVNIGGEKVDVARNYLIERCLETEAKYMLFVGEDTVLPYDGFNKLHEVAEKNPDSMVVGVYYIKHANAMIMVRTKEDYIIPANVEPGQIIETWMSGLDAALIPISLLRKLHEKDPDLPFCCIANNIDDLPFIGEDNFFVHRWHKAGYRILTNTDVQCLHMDLASGKYEAHPSVNLKNYYTQIPITTPFTIDDKAQSDSRWFNRIPQNSDSQIEAVEKVLGKDTPIKLNLGCGMFKMDGYVNIDKYYQHADIHVDVKDFHLPENTVEEIIAIHLLEHLNPHHIDMHLENWFKMLKVGGKLIMELPDVEEICKQYSTATKEEKGNLTICLYGAYDTYTEGKTTNITSPHLWGWSPETVEERLIKVGFKSIKVLPQTTQHPGPNFRIEATKE